MRYVLEGTWSGYTSEQEHVVHRTVVRHPEPYEKLTRILYTDGTALFLTVRPCKPREKVKEIHAYDSLIADCVTAGVDSVAALYEKRPAPERR